MNIEQKPIAESKVRQLGGDVCGVLVRTHDSEVMAVSEHGRCTRLDAGVMGPVEPAGMSERALFEQKFPAPQGVEWIDDNQGYRITSDDDYWWESEGQAHFRGYLGQWIGWQAARAQSGQGGGQISATLEHTEPDPVGFIPSSGLNNLNAGHPAKIYPMAAAPSPFESHSLVYTQSHSKGR